MSTPADDIYAAAFGTSPTGTTVSPGASAAEDLAAALFGPTKPPEPASGPFVAGVKSGMKQTAGLVQAGVGTVQKLLGAQEAGQTNVDIGSLKMEEGAAIAAPYPTTIEQIATPGDVADYILANVGQQVPNIIVAGLGAATGGVAGLGINAIRGRVFKQVMAEAAKKALVNKALIAGGAAATTLLETGGIAQEQKDIGVDNPAVALAGGTVNGALEFLTPYMLARSVGIGPAFENEFMKWLAKKPWYTKAGITALLGAGTEASTEAFQEGVSIAARAAVDAHYDTIGPEAAQRILNSAFAGGTVGAVFGGLSGPFVRARTGTNPTDTARDLYEEHFGALNSPSAKDIPGANQTVAREEARPIPAIPEHTSRVRLPTITIVGETGLETADPLSMRQVSAQREQLAREIALATPEENRTPAERALARMVENERAQAFEEAKKGNSIVVPTTYTTREQKTLAESVAGAEAVKAAAPAETAPPVAPVQPVDPATKIELWRQRTVEQARAQIAADLDKIAALRGTWASRDETSAVKLEETKVGRVEEVEVNSVTQRDAEVKAKSGIDLSLLTEKERNLFSILDEKESTEGLTEQEYAKMERLLSKAAGESKVDAYKKGTPEFQQREQELERETAAALEAAKKASLDKFDEEGDVYAKIGETNTDRTYATTSDQAAAWVNDVALPNGPQVIIVDNAQQLPAGRIQDVGKRPRTRALFVPDHGVVYVIANRNADAKSVHTSYFHEVLGHYGLGAMMGRASTAYRQFVDLMHRSFDMRPLAERYGLDVNNEAHKDVLAEEKFAQIAETNPKASIIDRVVGIVRGWLRKLFPELNYTPAEVRALVGDIRRFISAPVNRNYSPAKLTLDYAFRMEEAKNTREYTTRVLEALPKKDWITQDNVTQAIKAVKPKKGELELIQDVAAKMPRQFLRSEFEAEVLKRVASMEPAFVQYGDLARYGLERLQRAIVTPYKLEQAQLYLRNVRESTKHALAQMEKAITRGDALEAKQWKDIAEHDFKRMEQAQEAVTRMESQQAIEPSILVWEGPTATPLTWYPDLGHPALDTNNYLTHTRQFIGKTIVVEGERLESVPHVFEIQSNLVQNAKNIPKEAYMEELGSDGKVTGYKLIPGVGEEEVWRKAGDTLLTQTIRESIKFWAKKGYRTIRFATAETAAAIQDAVGENQGIWNRYAKDFPKVYKEYGGHLITEDGLSWWEIPLKESYKTDPVRVFSSVAENAAQKLRRSGSLRRGVEVSEETVDALSKFKSVMGVKINGGVMTLLQMAKKYNIEPIQRYTENVQKWWRTKMEIVEQFDKIATQWNSNSEMAQQLSQALFEISTESDRLERRLDTEKELLPILAKYKLDQYTTRDGATGIDLYFKIDKSFRDLLDRLEYGLKYNAALEAYQDPAIAQELVNKWNNAGVEERHAIIAEAVQDKSSKNFLLFPRLNRIETDLAKLRDRNYFPRKRFGQYSITVVSREDVEHEGQRFAAGQQMLFETHEDRNAQLERKDDLVEAYQKLGMQVEIKLGKLSDKEFAFVGLPPTLFDTLKNELELTEEQKEKLIEISTRISPGRSFLRHLLKRKGIAGFSQDALRTYASYGLAAASHIARVEHYLDMGQALSDLRSSRTALEGNVRDNAALNALYEYFNKHYGYILNPETDWAKLRALGFLWYLGFNVKSAMVNMTQIPMVLYPYLAGTHGDVKTMRAISLALVDAASVYSKSPKISNALNEMIDRGRKEGFLDESIATELAGFTESTVLERMLPISKGAKIFSDLTYYGAWMFRQAEQYNRLVSFIAATRLAELSGTVDPEQVFQAGKDAVQTAMFEYSKWNRPEFMRGRKSVFFLFWNWMQHASYLALGGAGGGVAVRMWLMLALAGGLMGLPFAENLADLIDFGGTKLRELMGVKEPKLAVRYSGQKLSQGLTEDLSDFISVLEDKPDIIMHGLARYYGLGPLHMLTALGVPVPNVDTTGSLSMGKVIPGIDQLLSTEQSPDTKFGRVAIQVLGPIAGIPYNLWKAVETPDPDVWKKWERALPVAIKNLSKGLRLGIRGEEEYTGGGSVAVFDPHDKQAQAELIAQMFGFGPTRLNSAYELQGVKEDMRRYYTTKRSMLLEDWRFASMHKNREGIADAKDAIRKFNKTLPDQARGLSITGEVMQKSLQTGLRRAQLRTKGVPNEKGVRPLFRKIEEVYVPSNKGTQ